MDLGVWFEISSEGCGLLETAFDAVTDGIEVREKRYLVPGQLAAVRIQVEPENYNHLVSELRHVSERFGTCAWIRDLSQLSYMKHWESGEHLGLQGGAGEDAQRQRLMNI